MLDLLDRTGLSSAQTPEALQEAIVALRDALSVGHVVYHFINGSSRQFAVHTYPDAWARLYVERDLARIDPVVLAATTRFHPFDWKDLDWSARPAREMIREAVRHGVGCQGFSVPIRGPGGQLGLFTVSSDADDAAWAVWCETHVANLIVVAHYANRRAMRMLGETSERAGPALSPREGDAIKLLAMGYSRAEAAAALSISEHTIRAYIEGARAKLGAQNTVHAVARAVATGVVVI